MSSLKREGDGIVHSRPGSVDQQSEDSFPTSDPPASSSPGAIGAPRDRKTQPLDGDSHAVKAAENKVKSGQTKDPAKY